MAARSLFNHFFRVFVGGYAGILGERHEYS